MIQTTSTEELYMILSYSRKTVNQTGDGHFSPMVAYHKGRDMLLILDVARYKYPFHWLPRMTVWDAMNKIDKETDETRGKHVDIEAFKAQHSSLEQFTNCVIQTTSTEELYMILFYSRKTVNQGRDMLLILDVARYKYPFHWLPPMTGRDMLLILDVARYKYPFHWLPRMTVWDAMNKIDKETDETRGKHVDIEAFKAQHSSLEQFTNCVIQTTSTEELYMILFYSRKTVNQGRDMLLILDVARYKYPFHWLPPMTGRDMLLILDVARYKYPFHWLPRMTVWDAMNKIDKETDETRGKHVDIEAFKVQHSSLEQFTNCVIQTTSTEELYMILSYSRKTVNQTGDGHFSPMAAYHKGGNMLLILDVACYKYPFHWLPRMTVWDAMNKIDKETDETRGFMMVRKKIS
ncbi:hypothetical protein HYC85_009206 [Camellia sinensis]|uniref:glutathione gamma-glutamylcysteinyltransferase n=1 Tax=Camellia sinensis TaxID=4442 RepID=A0A7J7HEC0_CAMSI|nr:hypothetical protein HYC85_009206 [Camellia sinensis]